MKHPRYSCDSSVIHFCTYDYRKFREFLLACSDYKRQTIDYWLHELKHRDELRCFTILGTSCHLKIDWIEVLDTDEIPF